MVPILIFKQPGCDPVNVWVIPVKVIEACLITPEQNGQEHCGNARGQSNNIYNCVYAAPRDMPEG